MTNLTPENANHPGSNPDEDRAATDQSDDARTELLPQQGHNQQPDESGSELGSESGAGLGSDAGAGTGAGLGAGSGAGLGTEPEPEPEPESGTNPDTDSNPGTESDTESAAETAEPAAVPFTPNDESQPVPLIEPDEPPANRETVTPHEPVTPYEPVAPKSDREPRTLLLPQTASDQTSSDQSASAPTSDAPTEIFQPAYQPPTEAHTQADYGQQSYDQQAYGQPDQTQPPAYSHQPIYVQAPIAPTKKGNRGVGTLLSLLGAVIFGVLYAGVAAVIILVTNHSSESFATIYTRFLSSWVFWAAIIGFAVVLIIIVLIVNRANWWAYVLGGFLVGAGAYFATIGGAYLSASGWTMTQSEGTAFLGRVALNPYTIAAGIAAREVSIWIGAWIAARARKVKLRNSEAEVEYQRQLQAAPSFQQPR